MSRINRWAVLISLCSVLLIAISACGTQAGSPTPTQLSREACHTEAAQTIEAKLTMTALAQPSATATETPSPTDTPTIAPTSPPLLTVTSSLPSISASVGTNCRLGPSTAYDPPVGVLLPGQTSEVHGRNDGSTWWYITNPTKPGQFCWVWGETTRVQGDTSGVPIVAPPPLPPTATFTATVAAAYTAAYDTVHDCGGSPTAIFKITNSGASALQSMSLKIEDVTTSTVLFGPTSSDIPFMGTNAECPEGGDQLSAGTTGYVGGAITGSSAGDTLRASIRLCTQNALNGVCLDKTVEFTAP